MRSSSQVLPVAVPPTQLRLWQPLSTPADAKTNPQAAPEFHTESGFIAQKFATGFYVSTPTLPLLPVLGSGALALPHGVFAPALGPATLTHVKVGAEVTVHFSSEPQSEPQNFDGFELRTSGLHLRAIRQWQPARVTSITAGATQNSAVLKHCHALLRQARPGVAQLPELIGDFVHAPTPPAARALLGLGPGSTPSGDDALCGALLALRIFRANEKLQRACRAVTAGQPRERTTALSASLLAAAALGYCTAQVRDALAELGRPVAAPTVESRIPAAELLEVDSAATKRARRTLERVAGVGYFSGHDLLVGAASTILALQASAPQLFSSTNRIGVRP